MTNHETVETILESLYEAAQNKDIYQKDAIATTKRVITDLLAQREKEAVEKVAGQIKTAMRNSLLSFGFSEKVASSYDEAIDKTVSEYQALASQKELE